jgi:hypothetical protein
LEAAVPEVGRGVFVGDEEDGYVRVGGGVYAVGGGRVVFAGVEGEGSEEGAD